MRRRLLALVAVAVSLGVAVSSALADQITVFAAASMKDALDRVASLYQTRSGDTVSIDYAASSTLAKQIQNGGPADLFISADLDWMDYLDQLHLLKPGTRSNLLGNRLVLIAPAASTVTVEIKPGFPLSQLLGEGRLAVGDPDSVPAGKYAKAALQNLGVWPSVENKLARAENVRAALVFVSREEAPLGIVYQTDAKADKSVRIAGEFPDDTHPPIVYPIAITVNSKTPRAEALLDFVKSSEAKGVFESYGFAVLP